MSSPSLRHRIHRASSTQDVESAAAIVADAFSALSATAWLVPNPTQRAGVLADVFAIIIGHALDYGQVDLLAVPDEKAVPDDLAVHDELAVPDEHGPAGPEELAIPDQHGPKVAAAVWFYNDHPVPPPPDYAQRLARAAGEFTPRFEVLDDLFDAHHPHEPHHYLSLLAVLPAYQRQGLGATLLRQHHAEAAGLPCYLEASTPDSRRLYIEHGYRPHGGPFSLPNQATFYPLWRE